MFRGEYIELVKGNNDRKVANVVKMDFEGLRYYFSDMDIYIKLGDFDKYFNHQFPEIYKTIDEAQLVNYDYVSEFLISYLENGGKLSRRQKEFSDKLSRLYKGHFKLLCKEFNEWIKEERELKLSAS